MEALFQPDAWPYWAVAMAIALFFPVRNLIWVQQVRRAERRLGGPADEAERGRLKRRAGITAGLICFVFAVLYARFLFLGDR